MSSGSGKNYFKVLELNIDCTSDDIRNAYKRLAKLWHPDKNHTEGAEDKFKEILEAYNTLKSDDRREIHARELRTSQQTANTKSTPMPSDMKFNMPQEEKKNDSDKFKPSSTDFKERFEFKTQQDNVHTEPNHRSFSSSKDYSKETKYRPHSVGKKSTKSNTSHKPHTKNPKSYQRSSMGFSSFEDPIDEIILELFLSFPQTYHNHHANPKQRHHLDPFGNTLPKNIKSNIYDWKSTAKKHATFQEYVDDETDFSCVHCGGLMPLDILRKHEPKCMRFGGKKSVSEEDENCDFEYKPTSKWGKAKQTQSRPEWNNDFTEPDYSQDLPQNLFSGKYPSKTPFHNTRINIDDFNPFDGIKISNQKGKCWLCSYAFGNNPPSFCPHT